VKKGLFGTLSEEEKWRKGRSLAWYFEVMQLVVVMTASGEQMVVKRIRDINTQMNE
jgi:hypothetical protein